MSRAELERLAAEKHPDDAGQEKLREQMESDRELTDDELEQAAGGDDGWGGGTAPPPGDGG
jgi:hypothetical protein